MCNKRLQCVHRGSFEAVIDDHKTASSVSGLAIMVLKPTGLWAERELKLLRKTKKQITVSV